MKRLSRVALWSSALLLLVSGLFQPCSLVAAASVIDASLAQAVEGADTPTPQESGVAAVTVLQGTLAALVEQFNRDAGNPRVLALLSPT